MKSLNDSKYLQALLLTIKEDRKEIFELLIRYKVLAGRPYPRDEKEELKSIKYILNNAIIYLIQHNKPTWLENILRTSIKIPKDKRELENINRYLRMSINLNNKQCFLIILKFIRFSKNREAASLILSSNFDERIDIFIKSISHLFKKETIILQILKNCIINKVKLQDLKKIIHLVKLNEKSKSQLCHTTLMNDYFEFYQYAKDINFFKFTDEHVYGTIFYGCSFLKQLLFWYGDIYKLYLDKLIVNEKNISWIMYRWDKMLTIFSHPNIGNNQKYINVIFESFIKKAKDFLSSLPSKHLRQMWLSSFCILLHCSDNEYGLSQHVTDILLSSSINNTITVSHSLTFFYCILIITLISYGYSFNNLSIIDQQFFKIVQEERNDIILRLFSIILENCNQAQLNNFQRRVKYKTTIMSLKGQSRWVIRNSLKRPFHKNLQKFVKTYKLPLYFRKLISLESEMDMYKILPLKYVIKNNQIIYDNDIQTDSPFYESLVILTSYRNAAYF